MEVLAANIKLHTHDGERPYITIIDITFYSLLHILTFTGGFTASILALFKLISIYFVHSNYNKTIIKVVSKFRNDLNK